MFLKKIISCRKALKKYLSFFEKMGMIIRKTGKGQTELSMHKYKRHFTHFFLNFDPSLSKTRLSNA